jgi:hypothetical protein
MKLPGTLHFNLTSKIAGGIYRIDCVVRQFRIFDIKMHIDVSPRAYNPPRSISMICRVLWGFLVQKLDIPRWQLWFNRTRIQLFVSLSHMSANFAF